MKLDFEKIDKYIEYNKTKKPHFCNVDISEWQDALDGYRVCFGESVGGGESTDHVWSLIYFSAIAFCKGLEYEEVKNGTKEQSSYPRY